MKRIVDYKDIGFFYKFAFMFLSTSVFKNNFPERLNLIFATAFLLCFRKEKCLSLTYLLSRSYDIL